MFSSKTGTGAIYFIDAKTSLDVYIINARDLQIVIQPDSQTPATKDIYFTKRDTLLPFSH